MRDILILTERDLRAAVPLDLEAVSVVEGAFRALSGGSVVMPPILSMEIADAHGEVDVKTAYIPGLPSFAIKMAPGFFDNPKLGLPSGNGLMIVFSATTGMVEAVLLDNGYLTDVRTAAAGAVSAKHLAPARVETAGVLGAGAHARLQLIAAHLVRPFKTALVWGRDSEKSKACARDIAAATGAEVHAVTDPFVVVRESQLVVTATPSRAPLVKAEWLHPGLHITAMGADQAGKTEIEPRALTVCDLYVADRSSQCALLGELAAARSAGYATDLSPAELGDIVTGKHPGRASDSSITICDLTGTGAQDTAIATHALAAARRAGAGTTIEA